jgi:23S rRNA (uracil1939-C5)-methyltransferase
LKPISVIWGMKKGEIIENVLIESMAAEGKCVARLPADQAGHNGLVVFITGGAPGDVANIQVTKIKSHYLEGKVSSFVSLSKNRTVPFCNHFGTCGGCTWQHLDYATQLTFKQQQVTDALERIGGLVIPPIKTIIPSQKTQFYRNRLDFTFSSNRWLTNEELNSGKPFGEPALGFHIPKMFDKIFDVEHCYLQPNPSNAIRLHVKDLAVKNNIPFFDLRKQVGFLRTITIRTSNENETMVILQVAQDKPEWLHLILDSLKSNFNIASLNYIINEKRNDTFLDQEIICHSGNAYITEHMTTPDGNGKLYFRIGPKSFYQTNSDQAYELYKVALALADLKGNELVYDLYTGTGTIANFVSSKAKQVIGLEYVATAIEDAKANAKLNHITNTNFFAGDIKDLLNENFLNQHGKPNVVITDPPRAGMHEDVCKMLLLAAPEKIVYVSCNPATQARDLAIFSQTYSVTEIQPVDMFPHTVHVENVVGLLRR